MTKLNRFFLFLLLYREIEKKIRVGADQKFQLAIR
jgi:hypothetical protein